MFINNPIVVFVLTTTLTKRRYQRLLTCFIA